MGVTDGTARQALTGAVTVIGGAAYYGAVRWLETRKGTGWGGLLGLAKAGRSCAFAATAAPERIGVQRSQHFIPEREQGLPTDGCKNFREETGRADTVTLARQRMCPPADCPRTRRSRRSVCDGYDSKAQVSASSVGVIDVRTRR
jgi:hypothetical protein